MPTPGGRGRAEGERWEGRCDGIGSRRRRQRSARGRRRSRRYSPRGGLPTPRSVRQIAQERRNPPLRQARSWACGGVCSGGGTRKQPPRACGTVACCTLLTVATTRSHTMRAGLMHAPQPLDMDERIWAGLAQALTTSTVSSVTQPHHVGVGVSTTSPGSGGSRRVRTGEQRGHKQASSIPTAPITRVERTPSACPRNPPSKAPGGAAAPPSNCMVAPKRPCSCCGTIAWRRLTWLMAPRPGHSDRRLVPRVSVANGRQARPIARTRLGRLHCRCLPTHCRGRSQVPPGRVRPAR